MHDYDRVGSNDYMCSLANAVDVASLAHTRKWVRGFHRLIVQGEDAEAGDIELAFKAHHNPELVEPPLEPEGDDAVPDPPELLALPPNELHITLWRARRLKVMDTKVFGKGSSDPFVSFSLGVSRETAAFRHCPFRSHHLLIGLPLPLPYSSTKSQNHQYSRSRSRPSGGKPLA